jgi:Spy/CpxP family protein refolding chaperone
MTTATASNYLGSQVTIFALANKPISQTIAFPQTELTPQERQKLQGVRQRRNKEIMEVLDSSQRTQLEHELHFSHDIDRALAVIDLNPQQQEFISTVIELTNLKMRAIFSHHALLERNYSRSQEL